MYGARVIPIYSFLNTLNVILRTQYEVLRDSIALTAKIPNGPNFKLSV